jgi:hypothetical protein
MNGTSFAANPKFCMTTVLVLLLVGYCPQITRLSLQRMRVLRQCMVLRAEVMFVTIQHENICASKKEMNKAVTVLKLPDVRS